ncbi:ABC transporter permease [Allorhizobium terrae]|uniref:ABC transporter permease n=1 Tax=Allorhizobium terrae TaxID=1848972 RepID=A0A4V3W982_9HYPH|nr:ABC transporter permease [Allorhizobium terrae]THF54067.1 ABC transporter permease [Allorhizobium terrae]
MTSPVQISAPLFSSLRRKARYAIIFAIIGVVTIFANLAPGFLTGANLLSVLVNNVALLAIVSIAMTFAVASGGIDLSVGTAVDFASFAFISLVLAGVPVSVAVVFALLAGGTVGVLNGVLISIIGISPFLATLGTLFIGRSVQQLLTNGGNPVYLPQTSIPEAFSFIGHGRLAGVPVPLIVTLLLVLVTATLLAKSRFGRVLTATGIQASVVRYSGLSVSKTVAAAYVIAGLIAAVAGIVLTATVNVYIPSSGNAFMLNAIGATFIGTTIHPLRRPNVTGTVLGVLLLGLVSNGLLLSGLNFYWQQVATGALIFSVLAFSFKTKSDGVIP